MTHARWSILALLGVAILITPLPMGTTVPVDRFFRIEASQFAYAPAVLRVNPGDRVTIELVSTDVVHGLAIDGHNLSVTADPGQSTHLTITADRAGSYRFRCTTTCGSLHPFMIGKLEVGPNMLLWRASALAALAVIGAVWGIRK